MTRASALWGTGAGQWFFKNVMVVEDDIDIRDPETVHPGDALHDPAGGVT
jgi:UbiD family decarboxylase